MEDEQGLKERLWQHMGIKGEMASIGFTQYDKMVAEATFSPGWVHLHTHIDLSPYGTSDKDYIHFVVNVEKDKKGNIKDIFRIHAFYESLFNHVATDESEMHVIFERKNGKFPVVDDMITSAVQEERNQLARYRNAYRVARSLQNLQNGLKNVFRLK
jgi:hypothetical protein